MSTIDTNSSSGFSDALLASVGGATNTGNSASTANTLSDQAGVDAEQNKFLTLLVTQLQNQDPLNPTDNAELTSQLAQLSTVTGVNQLNATLNTLQTSFQSSQALQATNMIGHGVLFSGDDLKLKTSQAVYGVNVPVAADSVVVSIINSAGKVVHTIDMGKQAAGTTTMGWDGTDDNAGGAGVPGTLPDGDYTVSVVAKVNGVALTDDAAAIPLTFGTVASVSTSAAGGVTLNIPSIVNKLTMTDIYQVL